jgi:hypothetical protein
MVTASGYSLVWIIGSPLLALLHRSAEAEAVMLLIRPPGQLGCAVASTPEFTDL